MITDLNEIADMVHLNAKRKGFHPKRESEDLFVVKQANNLHGEVSEFHDAWRLGKLHEPCDKADKMAALGYRPLTCAEEELADIIIRALDISRRLKIDIHNAIVVKHRYNLTRPYTHGGKKS